MTSFQLNNSDFEQDPSSYKYCLKSFDSGINMLNK